MDPVPVGTRVRVTKNLHSHSYTVGSIYTVVRVDDDGTFKAVDASGHVGNWLRWDECEPGTPSIWDRIAAELPPDIVRFLSCFDGMQSLSLKREVTDRILGSLPDLHDRITHLASTEAGEFATAGNRPYPIDAAHNPEETA
jgi:hypothetical protein